MGPIGHTLILYILPLLVIYYPMGWVIHMYFFKGLNEESGKLEHSSRYSSNLWIMHLVVGVFYIFVACLYYKVTLIPQITVYLINKTTLFQFCHKTPTEMENSTSFEMKDRDNHKNLQSTQAPNEVQNPLLNS